MRALAAVLAVGVAVTGCSGAASDPPFELEVLPEFVNGAFPEAELVLLATVDSTDDSPVAVTAVASGAAVVVEPGEIRPGEVAEIRVTPTMPTGEETLKVTVTGERGTIQRSTEKQTPVFPDVDQLGPEARRLLDVFTGWLAAERPDLGISPATVIDGNGVAPMLLVVSHYMFESEQWEIGVAWHIMIPPDDWAEIYLRPRGEPSPTLAFRLASRQAAFDEGVVEITEVAPPTEVVR